MEWWARAAAVGLGGALGANARYWLGAWVETWAGSRFPWATLTINVTGSFAIGAVAVVLARWLPHPQARLLIVTGFLGGYTTFSAYTTEALGLWSRGSRGSALAYLAGSVAAGFLATALGAFLAQELACPPLADNRAAPAVQERPQSS